MALKPRFNGDMIRASPVGYGHHGRHPLLHRLDDGPKRSFSTQPVISAQFFHRFLAGESAINKKPKYVINPQSNRYAYWQLVTSVALGFAAR